MKLSKLFVAGVFVATVFMANGANANATGSNNQCIDGTRASAYQTSFTRGSGTISTRDGRPLCESVDLVLESFLMPDTWDGKGWNPTAIPQTMHAIKAFTVPAGEPNYKNTLQIDVPEECKNTQLDFYFAPGYTSITTMTEDEELFIGGKIFAGKGECEEPKVQSIACSALTVTSDESKRTVKATVSGTSENTTIDGYKINFGDGTVTNESTGEHTYAKDGTYTVTGYVSGTVNGTETDATGNECQESVTFSTKIPPTPEQPKELPVTGAGSTLATFSLATLLGTIGHYIYKKRSLRS